MTRWLMGIVVGVICAAAVAMGEEVTVSTYYPSPRGVYNELRVNRLVLVDEATQQLYEMVMANGRLTVTDTKKQRTFLLLDLNESTR